MNLTSSDVLRGAMLGAGIDDPAVLTGKVNAEYPGPKIKASTVERWLAGDGIPDRYIPALKRTLPNLDLAALALALGEAAEGRRATAGEGA